MRYVIFSILISVSAFAQDHRPFDEGCQNGIMRTTNGGSENKAIQAYAKQECGKIADYLTQTNQWDGAQTSREEGCKAAFANVASMRGLDNDMSRLNEAQRLRKQMCPDS